VHRSDWSRYPFSCRIWRGMLWQGRVESGRPSDSSILHYICQPRQYAFSSFTLLLGHHEGHPVRKNRVLVLWWCGDLTGVFQFASCHLHYLLSILTAILPGGPGLVSTPECIQCGFHWS